VEALVWPQPRHYKKSREAVGIDQNCLAVTYEAARWDGRSFHDGRTEESAGGFGARVETDIR
jgi:hypothetical protein